MTERLTQDLNQELRHLREGRDDDQTQQRGVHEVGGQVGDVLEPQRGHSSAHSIQKGVAIPTLKMMRINMIIQMI